MYRLIKPMLFMMSPERAHGVTLRMFKFVLRTPFRNALLKRYQYHHPILETEVLGLQFKNPVGLAAGFDKNGANMHEFAALGFGFLEIGTITPKAQEGNPQPRLFRLPKDQALINRLGFNNHGATAAKHRLEKRPRNVIIGGNIGKNKSTPNEMAITDYLICFKELQPLVDYLHRHGRGVELTKEDFVSGRWEPAIQSACNLPGPTTPAAATGAEEAASHLARFF